MKKATTTTILPMLNDDNHSLYKEPKRLLCFLYLSVCSAVLLCGTVSAEEQPPSQMSWYDKQKALVQAYGKLKQVDVYGKVIDQWTNGVPDADVCLSGYTAGWMIRQRDKWYEVWSKTDKTGLFHAVLAYPDTASLTASKEGYEFIRGGYYKEPVQHRTTAENPVVIRMRKRGEETFLIKKPIESFHNRLLLTDGTNRVTKAWDMLMSLADLKTPPMEYADLVVDGAYNSDAKTWTLTVSTTNNTDGLILGNALLYQAPTDGYTKQCVIQVTNRYSQTQYVYLRSRQPAVYSRIALDYNLGYDPGKPDYLRVLYGFCLNPYGERSFEYDERVEAGFNVRQTLTKEAVAAIRSGEYPSKPADIGRQVREANEWFERDNEEKKRRSREFYEEQRKLKEAKAK